MYIKHFMAKLTNYYYLMSARMHLAIQNNLAQNAKKKVSVEMSRRDICCQTNCVRVFEVSKGCDSADSICISPTVGRVDATDVMKRFKASLKKRLFEN